MYIVQHRDLYILYVGLLHFFSLPNALSVSWWSVGRSVDRSMGRSVSRSIRWVDRFGGLGRSDGGGMYNM